MFHRLTFGEAIKRDLLTDYQVVVVGVDDATYKEWAEKGTLVTRDGKKSPTPAPWRDRSGWQRRCGSSTSIAPSRSTPASPVPASSPPRCPSHRVDARATATKGALWSSYASGEMTAGERHVRLQHLSRLDDGQRGLLTNARCLSEGVDVPTLDGVAFIDPDVGGGHRPGGRACDPQAADKKSAPSSYRCSSTRARTRRRPE